MDVRLLVGRTPLGGEALEHGLGIAIAKLGARIAARGAFGEDIDRCIQPDGYRALVQQLARARIDKGAAARRDHPNLTLDQPRDEPPFPIAKVALAIAFEDFGGGETGRVLDRTVAVDEGQAETLGQAPPDRRFSNTHQSDQHDGPVETLPQLNHVKDYTAAWPLGKSARMSRLVVLIVVVVILAGGLFFLSTLPSEQPTHQIEVPVAQGNAH